MVRHRSGAHVLLGPPKPVASGRAAVEPARVAEIVHRLERDGAHFVVIDVGADLGAVTTWVLSAAHDIFIVLTATASGVQDAYRSTEALRRLGLGHKLRYVVNRARGTPDLSEVMGDLGGRIVAVVPEDPTVEDAENRHRSVALDDSGPAAAALHDLAALLYPPLTTAARRTRLGWLPWRRGVG
jgi:MinD-like ATPase involved in chromosome partitioning or flagellar assembly